MWLLHHIYSTHEHILFKNHTAMLLIFLMFFKYALNSLSLSSLSLTHTFSNTMTDGIWQFTLRATPGGDDLLRRLAKREREGEREGGKRRTEREEIKKE